MAISIPYNDQFILLLWATGITFAAVIIGWLIKRYSRKWFG
jgi:hypothetical protein